MDIFAFPNFLWLLFYGFLAALIAIYWIPRKRKKQLARLIHQKNLLPYILPAAQNDLRKAKAILFSTATLAIILALAGPQWGLKSQELPQVGGNLLIALDISDSMLAEDIKPNRLERAKLEITEAFISNPKNNPYRIGLVTFAGKAYLQCPLTLDAGALRYILETVTAGSLPYAGTNISSALKVAQILLEHMGGAKNVLLVTDGEDHQGELQSMAQALAKSGIRISALWVGSAQGEPIPLKDENGNFLGYKKDKEGKTVLSKARGDSLETVAQLSGGKFIRFNAEINIQNELREIMEGSPDKKGKDKGMILENRFQWPLGVGLLLLITELLVPERKKTSRKKNA